MNAANGSERLVKGVQRRLQIGKRIIGISAGSLFRRPARIGRLLGVHEACPAALSRSGGSDLTFPLSSCSRLALCARLLHALVLKRIRLGAFRRHSFPPGEAGPAFCIVPSKLSTARPMLRLIAALMPPAACSETCGRCTFSSTPATASL